MQKIFHASPPGRFRAFLPDLHAGRSCKKFPNQSLHRQGASSRLRAALTIKLYSKGSQFPAMGVLRRVWSRPQLEEFLDPTLSYLGGKDAHSAGSDTSIMFCARTVEC